MMFKKIYTWILVIASVKILLALIVRQMGIDPRRDIAAKEKLCNTYHPNTVFIGTSRTLYAVNTTLFDSLNVQKTRSYNLGLFSLSSANAYALTNRLIKENNDVKNIFVELSALDHNTILLRPNNLVDEVIFRFCATRDMHHLDWHDKISDFLFGANATVFNSFSIANEIDAFKNRMKLVKDSRGRGANLQEQGYQSADGHISRINQTILAQKISVTSVMYNQKIGNPNAFYISKINELIETAKRHKKQVFFYFPNNLSKSEEHILSEIVPFLPAQNLMKFPNDEHFEQLFLADNLFDNYHLNVDGSKVYTTTLFKESANLLE